MIFDVFIKKLDEVTLNDMHFSAKQNGDWLEIYLNHGEMPAFKISLIETFHLVTVGKIRGLFDEWKKIADLCWEFASTPINERFPEKKYCLRWFDDEFGKTFLGFCKIGGKKYWSTFNTQTPKTIFTKSELEQLKKDNPRLAPAIDAMKEPAEDKDE